MKHLSTTTWRPLSLMNGLDSMLNHYMETSDPRVGFAVDTAETNEGYRVLADLPGFAASEIDVRIDSNALVIEASVKDRNEEEITWLSRERLQGNRKRSLILPDDVDRNSVEATMENGTLIVELKKSPEFKPVNIKVQG